MSIQFQVLSIYSLITVVRLFATTPIGEKTLNVDIESRDQQLLRFVMHTGDSELIFTAEDFKKFAKIINQCNRFVDSITA